MPTTLKDVPGFAPHGGALELRMAGSDEIDGLRREAAALSDDRGQGRVGSCPISSCLRSARSSPTEAS